VECYIDIMLSHSNRQERSEPAGRIMPLAWCAVTTVIIAAGLTVPFEAGPQAAGFDYLFTAGGYDTAFTQSLAAYGAAAAGLGAGFMFVPRMTGWRFRKGLAWATFMLMVIGGIMMLIVPPFLRLLVSDHEGPVTSTAVWSVVWMDSGARISVAGGLVALATFFDAWLRRAR
jgi:hypothetical protein